MRLEYIYIYIIEWAGKSYKFKAKKLEKHLFSPKKAGKNIVLFCGHPVEAAEFKKWL